MNIEIGIHNPVKVRREREVYEANGYHTKFWMDRYTFSEGFQTVEIKVFHHSEPPEMEEGPGYVG